MVTIYLQVNLWLILAICHKTFYLRATIKQVLDNPPFIQYNTLVTWFEEIVKFDFCFFSKRSNYGIGTSYWSDFSHKGRSPAIFAF